MEVHRQLGPGFLEQVYENALCHEFTLKNIRFERQVEIPVMYKGIRLSTYKADVVAEESVIIEVKAVSTLIDCHVAQAMHYLAATGRRLAILINFGSESLQSKRIVR